MGEGVQRKVLTVGATGAAAGLVVPELRKRGVHVRALVHKPEEEQAAREAGAHEVVAGDLKDAAVAAKALVGMDAAFYLAPVALEDEAGVGRRFIAQVKEAGVRRVVFSSVIHPVLSRLPNHAGKAPVEEAILASGLEYVFLHPAVFFQNFERSWAQVQETGILAEPWSSETRFSRVDYRDVAEVAASALIGERLLYGTFELCAEGRLNRYDVAAVLTEVLGRTVTARKVDPPAQPGKLARMFAWYDAHPLLGNPATLRGILGREPRTLRAYFEELHAATAPRQEPSAA